MFFIAKVQLCPKQPGCSTQGLPLSYHDRARPIGVATLGTRIQLINLARLAQNLTFSGALSIRLKL